MRLVGFDPASGARAATSLIAGIGAGMGAARVDADRERMVRMSMKKVKMKEVGRVSMANMIDSWSRLVVVGEEGVCSRKDSGFKCAARGVDLADAE
jgi:hypothetical protein